jgi:hypothetical protein
MRASHAVVLSGVSDGTEQQATGEQYSGHG